jgi:NAD(P)H dehydrogenase (quinone)
MDPACLCCCHLERRISDNKPESDNVQPQPQRGDHACLASTKHKIKERSMSRIVINGASGQLGRSIVENLAQHMSPEMLTLVSRTPEALADWAAKGARVAKGDYRDPDSLDAAYAGADTLMMISGLDIRHRVPQHANAIAAAQKAGIGHIVYTSVSGVHPLNRTPSSGDHVATEKMLRESGLGFTCLRNQAYSEFMTMMAEVPLRTGKWYHVGERGLFSPVTRADIALCASTILLAPQRHDGVAYEITGPELISFQELARRFSNLYNRLIDYVPLTAEGMYARFDELGAPRIGDPRAIDPPFCFGSEELVENYVAWDELFHATLSHHVELITGKPATPLGEVMLAAKADMEKRLAMSA